MIQEKNNRRILCSIGNGPIAVWRAELENLKSNSSQEYAVFLNKFSAEERRELFREFETMPELSIPFVQVADDMQSWEFDFLTTRHRTEFFSFFSEPNFFTQAVLLQKYKEQIIFENPVQAAHADLFTDEALTRSGVAGICLHLGNLENDRLHNKNKYQTTIHALDHHTLKATRISPGISAWWRKFLTPRRRRLQGITELNYLKQMPLNYFAPLLIIDADNTLDEQQEIKEYIRLLLA